MNAENVKNINQVGKFPNVFKFVKLALPFVIHVKIRKD